MLLLDTNIVGYFFRRDSRAALYERHLVEQPPGISFATLAELYQWLTLRSFTAANRLGAGFAFVGWQVLLLPQLTLRFDRPQKSHEIRVT